MRYACAGMLATVVLSLIWAGRAGAAETALPAIGSAELKADWLLQARLRGARHPSDKPATTADDAVGGCDGVKNGQWGFHTNRNNAPSWWQVDLGSAHRLDRIVVYNRCDFPAPPLMQPTAWMQILLSADAKTWRVAYAHNGSNFYGISDGKPLVIGLNGDEARFVRLQVPPDNYLHFDELEAFGVDAPAKNLALHRPANQSTTSQWSTRKTPAPPGEGGELPLAQTIARGRQLAADLKASGVKIDAEAAAMEQIAESAKLAKGDASRTRELYLQAHAALRRLTMANPLLDFDSVLFVKRAPGSFSHMSDQYYSWFSRPGGGVYILENFKSDNPRLRCLSSAFPEGSFLSPDLSFDGRRILFSYCRYYPGRSQIANKLDKEAQPEDSFYHIFEINIDGSGLRQITRGRYDDIFPRYLPDGQIVFLSTRRGQFLQCGKESAAATLNATLPDCFVRCGGDAGRPVSVYTLHSMAADGGALRAISPFENFEWDPSVGDDGRLLYARWDYVDRDNMPYMKLWATNPDGTNSQAVWGNFTRNPQCAFEPRSVPNSRKIIFTAAAHHALTGGSLVLLDSSLGQLDGVSPITRLTPEVLFPESEGWSEAFYANPYPLSERYFLTAWGGPMQPGCPPQADWGTTGPVNALGIYLFDAFGNLQLLYRDPALSSMYPIPVRKRSLPPKLASAVDWDGQQEGRMMLLDVYAGLSGVERGSIRRLRIVAMPAKVQPVMNSPQLGVTGDDPGKCVLGTVPVEADGSAHFRLPSGVAVFFQALDADGRAVQTMRSLTYVQPGQTLSCIGCHEPRSTTPASGKAPLAARRAASKIKPGPDGSWPLRFDKLVQPVLDRHCTSCHRPGSGDATAARYDLSPAKAWENLIGYGRPSLRDHVRQRYSQGRSVPNAGPSQTSALMAMLCTPDGHHGVKLDADSLERLMTWMDTYGQRLGSYSEEQEEQLRRFRSRMADMLEP